MPKSERHLPSRHHVNPKLFNYFSAQCRCRCSFNTHKTSSRLEPQMFDWKPKLFHVWWLIRGHQIALTPDGVFDGGRLGVCETHFSFCPWSRLNCLQQKKWIYNNMLFYLWILNVFSFLTVLFLFCFLTKISLLREKKKYFLLILKFAVEMN